MFVYSDMWSLNPAIETYSKYLKINAKTQRDNSQIVYNQIYNLRTQREKLNSFSWRLSFLALFALKNIFYNEPSGITQL